MRTFSWKILKFDAGLDILQHLQNSKSRNQMHINQKENSFAKL